MDSWVIPEHASNKGKSWVGGMVGILAKIIGPLKGRYCQILSILPVMLRHETSRNYPKWAMSYGGIQSRAKNLFLFFFGKSVIPNRKMRKPFFIFCPYQGELLKNISPPLGVFRLTIRFSIKMSPPLGVAYPGKHLSFRRKPFSLRPISLAEKWKECR